MKKLLSILIVLSIAKIGLGQVDKRPSYLDSNGIVDFKVITVKEFMKELIVNKREENTIYTLNYNHPADTNWITKEDIKYLMNFIYSKQDAKCIMNISASLLGKGSSTIGDQAIRLIEAYRNKENFPNEMLICSKYNDNKKNEIEKWWNIEKDTTEISYGSVKDNFIGGTPEFHNVFRNKLEYPDSLKKEGVFGIVFFEIEIDTLGYISNFKILRGVAKKMDEEVQKKIYLTNGKWKPLIIKNRKVPYKVFETVYFELR